MATDARGIPNLASTFSPFSAASACSAAPLSRRHNFESSPDTVNSRPVAGLQQEYINIGTDGLNINAATPNWFIHSGSGNDAIAVSSGTNVLDGGTGSNFLTGGSGADTFFVDDRAHAADIWSTVNNFHAGDAATIWGITPQDYSLDWVDGQGAVGYTGLTLHAMAPGVPTASLTLVGFTQSDLKDGRLSYSFGSSNGSSYLYVHDNG
jgi:Ca2+-binding RTX toxin-like protein